MSDIITRTFPSGADLALTLDNREYARVMAIGTGWTRLRIGALIAVAPNGTSNLTGVKLVIGASAGKTSPYSVSSSTNFIGAFIPGTNQSTGGTLTYNANSGNPCYQASGQGTPFKKVATTITAGSAYSTGSNAMIVTNNGAAQRKYPIFVELLKGSPNWTITFFSNTGTFVNAERTTTQFRDDLATSSLGAPYTASDARTLAFDESAGSIDSACLFWNIAAFPLEVYDFRAYRFA